MQVGQIVVCKIGSESSSRGDPGVCFELYDDIGKPGCGVIWEDGSITPFDISDVDMFVTVTNDIEESVKDYAFSNTNKLRMDWQNGYFNGAFKAGRLWR